MRGMDSLQRLAFLLVLVGISTIYATSLLFSPDKVSVSQIGDGLLGESVRVSGTVRDLSNTEDAVFFDLEGEESEIRAVYFGSSLDVEEGERYIFDGRVDIYRGELEIVVDRVVPGEPSLG